MKHFAHDCTALEDKKIQRLMAKHGLAGYGFYFACLELIGQKIKATSLTCELELEPEDLAYRFRTRLVLIKSYLSTILDLGLFWKDPKTKKIYCFKILSRVEKNVGYNPEFKKWLEEFQQSVLYQSYLSTTLVRNELNKPTNELDF